jgi:predicted nucleic acid-binding protein
LDANILIRAVLGVRVRDLLVRYGHDVEFFAPAVAFAEAERHLPTIADKRRVSSQPLLESLGLLRGVVDAVPEEATTPLRDVALDRIGTRDPMDWPIVAAALALDCPIWTEDKDFFGSGMATWTTDRIEIYLRG